MVWKRSYVQVSSLLWNESYKEIVSGHGYPNNQLTIWQYPSMSKKADLTGHTNRILQMVQSPDQAKVMSAAGDETLRLWHCFERKTHDISKKLKLNDSRTLKLLTNIRWYSDTQHCTIYLFWIIKICVIVLIVFRKFYERNTRSVPCINSYRDFIRFSKKSFSKFRSHAMLHFARINRF